MYKVKLLTTFAAIALIASIVNCKEAMISGGIGVDSSKPKSKQCSQPTDTDDRILIADTVKNIPISKSKLRTLGLKRIYYRDKSLSLIVPGSWKYLRADVKNYHILYMQEKKSPTVKSELLLTKVPFGKAFIAKYPGVEGIKFYYDNLTNKKSKADIVKALKYVTLPDKIYARFARKIRVDGLNIYEYHFLMLQKNILYDLSLFGDKRHADSSKFLSTLGIYSLWTQDDCQKGSTAVKVRTAKKTDNGGNSDQILLANVVKGVPGIKKELSSFKLKRVSKKGVSLIVPGKWKTINSKDKDTLFTLKGYIKGHTYEAEISKLSRKDLGETNNISSEDIVLTMVNTLSERIAKESRKKGLKSKVILYPTPEETKGGTATYTILKIYNNKGVMWMSIGVVYDKQNLYFISSNTVNRDSKYIKFFTRLMSKSLKAN
jgi:hypothetical protein